MMGKGGGYAGVAKMAKHNKLQVKSTGSQTQVDISADVVDGLYVTGYSVAVECASVAYREHINTALQQPIHLADLGMALTNTLNQHLNHVKCLIKANETAKKQGF